LLRSAYVTLLRTVAAPLRLVGILSRLERAPRNSFRFWIGSQFAIYDAAALARMDTPWWSLPAIDEVERWIANRQGEVSVFEYGSGASTVWLARRCRHVVSVEHDVEFTRAIASMLKRDNISLRLIEPRRNVPTPQTPSGRRGYEHCDFSAYVDGIAAGDGYDLIVIDGRARNACLARAQSRLKTGGLIVFDNSNRRRYQAALSSVSARLVRYRGWTPALPYRSETALIEWQQE
jgi:hypothetical protein